MWLIKATVQLYQTICIMQAKHQTILTYILLSDTLRIFF